MDYVCIIVTIYFMVSVHQAQSHLPHTSSKLIPDNIRNLLQRETEWDFDIIELERVTQKR